MTIKSFYSKAVNSNSVIESMIIGKSDQRGFIRMDIESEISFKIADGSKSFTGKTNDLSATGVAFNTDTVVSVGDTLHLTVKPGTSITPPLEVSVSVIRVEPSKDGGYNVASEICQ